MDNLIYVIPAMGIVGLLYTFIKYSWVSKQDAGNDTDERDKHLHC